MNLQDQMKELQNTIASLEAQGAPPVNRPTPATHLAGGLHEGVNMNAQINDEFMSQLGAVVSSFYPPFLPSNWFID